MMMVVLLRYHPRARYGIYWLAAMSEAMAFCEVLGHRHGAGVRNDIVVYAAGAGKVF